MTLLDTKTFGQFLAEALDEDDHNYRMSLLVKAHNAGAGLEIQYYDNGTKYFINPDIALGQIEEIHIKGRVQDDE